jgi:hypothetical protein
MYPGILKTPASKACRTLAIGMPEPFLELYADFWRFHQRRYINSLDSEKLAATLL